MPWIRRFAWRSNDRGMTQARRCIGRNLGHTAEYAHRDEMHSFGCAVAISL